MLAPNENPISPSKDGRGRMGDGIMANSCPSSKNPNPRIWFYRSPWAPILFLPATKGFWVVTSDLGSEVPSLVVVLPFLFAYSFPSPKQPLRVYSLLPGSNPGGGRDVF